MNRLYVLEINPLSITLQIFCPILFIFVFISMILRDGSKKMLLQFTSESILAMSSSRSFIMSALTLRSLIHFELIFVYVVKE